MGKYGTNVDGFGAFEGGVNADKGAPLISTNSDGAESLLMGAPLIREIQAGVANGDFAITPDDASSTITSTNPLPYWTFTDVSSAGAITCAIVADGSNASGNILRWSVAGGTTTGKSATLTRYVSVPGSRNREFVFIPEMTLLAATASTVINATIGFTWYKSDGTTTTGTGNTTSTANTFTVIGAGPTTITASTSAVNTAAPSDAAFMLITITIATTGTVSAGTKTVDLAEVRIASGQSDVYVAENTTPATYGPSRFRQANGTLTLQPNLGGSGAFDVSGTMTNTVSSTNKLTILGGNIQSIGTATGSNVLQAYVTTDSNNRFKLEQDGTISWGSGAAAVDTNLYRSAANTLKTDDDFLSTGIVTGAAVESNGAINAAGAMSATNISLSGTNGVRHDTPATTSGTGQIAGMAMWVLVSGTNYQIRRSTGTSWARFKDNIEPTNISPEQFAALNFVQFDWNAEKLLEQYPDLDSVDQNKQHGLLLDQLVDVLPEAVQQPNNSTDTETVNWHAVYLAAMVALQDAIKRVNDLEERVKALEAK
jgi:hypothetical protein